MPSHAGTGRQPAPAWVRSAGQDTGIAPPGSELKRDIRVWSLKNAGSRALHLSVPIAMLLVSRRSFPLHPGGANGTQHAADGPAVTRAARCSGSI